MLTWSATASELLNAAGICQLLTDILFFNVKTLPFAGESARQQSNIAFSVLKYAVFLPVVAWLPIAAEAWMEMNILHFVLAATVLAAVHLLIRIANRAMIREHCAMPALEDDEEDFPMKLGLRY